MVAARNLAATMASSPFVIALSLMVLAGCATTQGNLSTSAERLERSSEILSRSARGDGYSREAAELADQAEEFRRTVLDRRADDSEVRASFESLSRDYHALRDEVDRSDSREAAADFRPVTEAYLDIEREMGGFTDNRRYARDRDERDRDYRNR